MNVGKVPPLFGTNMQLYFKFMLCWNPRLDKGCNMAKGGGLPSASQPATEMTCLVLNQLQPLFFTVTHI